MGYWLSIFAITTRRLTKTVNDATPNLGNKITFSLALANAGRLADEETDGLRVVIELPMRVLLSGLSRMLEFLLTEVEPVELLLTEMLDEGLRELEEPEGLEIVIRLDVDPPGLLLEDIVPERLEKIA